MKERGRIGGRRALLHSSGSVIGSLGTVLKNLSSELRERLRESNMEISQRLCYNQAMSLTNRTQQTEVVRCLHRAETFWSRALGLLGRAPLPPGEGLWLAPCRWVHTLGMRSPIEVIYVNAEGVIVGMQTLPPHRFGRYTPQAWGVLEVPVGTWVQSRCCLGDALSSTALDVFHQEGA